MNIAFIGDSITEGIPGVSYIDMLQSKLPDHHILNYGKGGDTVGSVYKRVQKIQFPDGLDMIFLFVGVNDIFGTINKQHRLLKILTRQTPADNLEELTENYQLLIEYLKDKTKRLIVISPLLLGEDIDGEWNQQLASVVQEIERVVSMNPDCDYLDVRYDCILALREKTISSYVPFSLREVIQDVRKLKTPDQVDKQADLRGLHLTLDGVHLNSAGAFIVCDKVLEYILGHKE